MPSEHRPGVKAPDEDEDSRMSSGATAAEEKSTTEDKSATEDKPAAEEKGATEEKAAPKPSLLKKIWIKSGLNPIMVMLMIKGALPPILVLASYAKIYSTLAYLSAIMSLLTMGFLPQAKFMQTVFYTVLFTCVGAAQGLLVIRCAVSARTSTESATVAAPGSSGGLEALTYNAAASATAGVWLFALIYLAALLRAYRPQLAMPLIMHMIFIIIVAVYAPLFPTMEVGLKFIRLLLVVFLTGFAFAFGVNVFIFPISSRMIADKQIAGMLGLISAALNAHADYMSALRNAQKNDLPGTESKEVDELTTKAKALKGNISAIGALLSKLRLEINFAKKEIGYGKIGPKEYSEILLELVHIILPVVGTSTLLGIMEIIGQKSKESGETTKSDEIRQAVRFLRTEEWSEIMSMSPEPYTKLQTSILQGIKHIGLVTGVFPKPKKSGKQGDIEKDGGSVPPPGHTEFSKSLRATLDAFHKHREGAVLRWCKRQGIEMPKSFWDQPTVPPSPLDNPDVAESISKSQKQQQLYVLLYTEYLIYSIGQSVLETVDYVDAKYADGTFARNRIILPGFRRIRKLIFNVFAEHDTYNSYADGDTIVSVGDSLSKSKKDPEHLPPTTFFQKATNPLRKIPHVLAGPQSGYAFRTGVATISIGILAYLDETYVFFNKQRGMWTLMIACLSMDRHTGRGIFGFIFRAIGTTIAMVASIVIWYIGDGHAGAIIPVFFIYLCACMWYLLKYPSMITVAIISQVTVVLIIGYELQDEKLGRHTTESNGQPYYKIYILAPYRLATVLVGLGTAAFWTFFPYPFTTHSMIRNDLGKALYLLGNYYSCAHTTIYTRLSTGSLGAETVRGKPLYQLAKARHKVFGKGVTMLTNLRQYLDFAKWEPTFGGRFPREKYSELVDGAQHILNYTSLMVFCSVAFTYDGKKGRNSANYSDAVRSEWLRGFAKVTSSLRPVDHELTSRLCLLASSLTNKQPLPPYLRMPQSVNLAKQMAQVDPGILSVHHIREPCYAAFAVLEVASTLLQEEVEKVSEQVRQLVGEVDFSFHVISTANSSASSLGGCDGGHGGEQASTSSDGGNKANKQD
ncbi:hypothetical protein DV735_g205, partial [Chaetothyriales sp. CBS 134920]